LLVIVEYIELIESGYVEIRETIVSMKTGKVISLSHFRRMFGGKLTSFALNGYVDTDAN
jgi:hypothetical protein